MGMFSNIANAAPFVGSTLKSTTGGLGEAVLSGIPFIGDSFAAQQAQRFNSAEASKQRDWADAEADKSREFNSAESLKSRQFSSEEAIENRRFQKMMSDSAHQREVTDLKKAGLNPILSVNSGASTPSGSAPTGAMASSSTPSGSSASGMKAQGGKGAESLIQDLYRKTREKAGVEISNLKQTEKTGRANEAVAKETKKVMSNSAKKLEAETNMTKNLDKKAAAQGDFWEKNGKAMMWMDMIHKGSNSANSIMDLFNPLRKLAPYKRVPKGFQPFNPKTGEILNRWNSYK